MSDIQDWCKEILPVINAAASGESIQVRPIGGDCWGDLRAACIRGDMGFEYRIKPRTIKIGDFDVPEPMRVDVGIGNKYFTISLGGASAISCVWLGDGRDYELLRNGLCHETHEAAELHAKAIVLLTSAK